MDFSAFLAIATVVTGVIWGIDLCFFKTKRLKNSQAGQLAAEPKIVEYSRSFFPILFIVLILRSFIAEPFRIPSGSMKPTLLEGDFILVNKYIYGIRLPMFGTKVIKVQEPKRGDILVFRFPKDPSIDFIKRVIGLPGDRISYQNKVVYLNGKPLSQESLGTSEDLDIYGQRHLLKHFKESLDNQFTHSIYVDPRREEGNHDEIIVPQGSYFVMGDNRDNSEDSRSWGFVPENLILGKAFFVWMSWDGSAKDLRYKRIGHKIK